MECYIALDPGQATALSAASHLTCPCGQSDAKEFEHDNKEKKKRKQREKNNIKDKTKVGWPITFNESHEIIIVFFFPL